MAMKIGSAKLLIFLCFLAILRVSLLPQDIQNPDSDTWRVVSDYLECFLADPVANFPLLKRIDNVGYWTLIYNAVKKEDYLHELFSKQFPVSGIDEAKLGVILSLLKVYTSPTSYEIPKPIISRIIEISTSKPEWFAKNLLSKADWREITRLIIDADIENRLGQRKGLRDILSAVKDQEAKKQLLDLFHELDCEDQSELGRFEEFMKDPAGNLGKITNIYNICSTIGRHDDMHLDENKTLSPKDNSILILRDWVRSDTNEKKIKVLFHLFNHCDSAYHQIILSGMAIAVLFEHRTLFVSALKDEPNWRMIMLRLSEPLYNRDKGFHNTLGILGNSDFEIRLRSQLEFLRGIFDSEY